MKLSFLARVSYHKDSPNPLNLAYGLELTWTLHTIVPSESLESWSNQHWPCCTRSGQYTGGQRTPHLLVHSQHYKRTRIWRFEPRARTFLCLGPGIKSNYVYTYILFLSVGLHGLESLLLEYQVKPRQGIWVMEPAHHFLYLEVELNQDQINFFDIHIQRLIVELNCQ